MATPKLYDLARVVTASTGTASTITLGSAVLGFLTFALAGVQDGDTVPYGIKDGSNSEVGFGVWSSGTNTLTRNVTKSTNSNALISLSGTAIVYVTARAEDFALLAPLASPALTGNVTIGTIAKQAALNVAVTAGGAVLTKKGNKTVLQAGPPAMFNTWDATPPAASYEGDVIIKNGTLSIRNNTQGPMQLHLSGSGGSDGAYLLGFLDQYFIMSGGGRFNGASWEAEATGVTNIQVGGGSLSIYYNSGLAIGGTFSPTLIYTFDTTGAYPGTTNAFTLGQSTKRWSTVYGVLGDFSGAVSASSLTLTTPLAVAQGGTASTTASGARSNLGAAASGANTDITSLGGLTTALSPVQGGTGQTSYTVGDLLYASGSSTLSKLAAVATGNALISGGVGAAPSWGKITTSHTTGIAASGANTDITSLGPLTLNGRTTINASTLAANVESAFEVTGTFTSSSSAPSADGVLLRSRATIGGNALTLTGLDLVPIMAPTATGALCRGAAIGATFAPPLGVAITAHAADYVLVLGGTFVGGSTAGTISTATTMDVGQPYNGGISPTTIHGVYVHNHGISALDNVTSIGATNVYGIYVEPQTGGTNNYAAYLNGAVTITGALTLNTALTELNGGTGNAAYATGDILYASGTNVLSRLAAAAANNALLSGTTPSWGKITTSYTTGIAASGSNSDITGVRAATATPAGGSSSALLLFGTTAGFGIYYGSGVPTVSARQGSLYLRSDASSTAGSRLYINTSAGTGVTWTGI